MEKRVLVFLGHKGRLTYRELSGAFGPAQHQVDKVQDAIQVLLEQGSIRWAQDEDKLEVAP